MRKITSWDPDPGPLPPGTMSQDWDGIIELGIESVMELEVTEKHIIRQTKNILESLE